MAPDSPSNILRGGADPAPEVEDSLRAGLEEMRYQGPVTLELGRYFAACLKAAMPPGLWISRPIWGGATALWTAAFTR